MKLLLIMLLLSLSTVVVAQPSVPSSLRTRIADDEKTLSIQIDGYTNGRNVYYNRTFDISGMNSLQKTVLKYRAFDSVGAGLPFHEMSWLIFMALGAAGVVITLLIVGLQRIKLTL